jgi:hypothetical protein
MRHAILALLLLALTAASANAAPWAFVEQDGRRTALQGEVHLKKKPFQLVFEGPASDQYFVLAAVDLKELEGRMARQIEDAKADKGSASLFSFAFVAAVDTATADANYLVVNNKGVLGIDQFTTQIWMDDKEAHCFQTLTKIGRNRVRATRPINTLLLNQGFRKDNLEIPTAELPGSAIHALLGRVHEKDRGVEDLSLVTLVFDRE